MLPERQMRVTGTVVELLRTMVTTRARYSYRESGAVLVVVFRLVKICAQSLIHGFHISCLLLLFWRGPQ